MGHERETARLQSQLQLEQAQRAEMAAYVKVKGIGILKGQGHEHETARLQSQLQLEQAQRAEMAAHVKVKGIDLN